MKFRLFVASLLLVSCSTPVFYQIAKVNCVNCSNAGDSYENNTDSLNIKYTFWAENGGMFFNIRNSFNRPVYIDWGKSFFFINGQRYAYWQDVQAIQNSQYSKMLTVPLAGPIYLSNAYTLGHSTIVKTERVSYLPPNSNYAPTQGFIIAQTPIELPIDSREIKDSMPRPTCTGCSPIQDIYYQQRYNEGNAIVKFRLFIVWSFDETFKSEKYIDNVFFVDEINEMNNSLIDYKNSNGKINGSVSFYKAVPKKSSLHYRKKEDARQERLGKIYQPNY